MFNRTNLAGLVVIIILLLGGRRAGENAVEQIRFLSIVRQILVDNPCTTSSHTLSQTLSPRYQLVVAGALANAGCTDVEAQLAANASYGSRQQLLNFQLGHLRWQEGEFDQAVAYWNKVDGVQQWMLRQASATPDGDVTHAANWYEASILSTSSKTLQAEAIAQYTERLRGKMETTEFNLRLQELEKSFSSDSPVAARLRGIRMLNGGSYPAAYNDFTEAIDGGFDDSETRYMLAEAALRTEGVDQAITIMSSVFDAPYQVEERAPWYLNRLGTLLVSRDRITEAQPFLEEAVKLSNYYGYSDNLAILYARLGAWESARSTCAKARVFAGTNQQTLQCESP